MMMGDEEEDEDDKSVIMNEVMSLFTGMGGLDGRRQIKIALCYKNGSTQRKSSQYPSIYRRASH